MICETKFLDIDGEPSSAYYNNLHKGEDVALKMYISDMAKHAYAKLQKPSMSKEQLIKESKMVNLTSDEAHYRFDTSNVNLDRTTSFIGNLQDEFNSKEVASQVSKRDIAGTILKMNMEKYKVSDRELKTMSKSAIYGLPGMEAAVEEFIKEGKGKDMYNRSVKNLIELWDWKRESGTEIHEVLEWYVEERNKLKSSEDGYKDYDSARANTIKRLKAKGTESRLGDYETLIDQIEKWMKSLGSKFEFATEVKIYDEVLGVAGTIDLLGFDANGNVHIFDYKTKEVNKQHLFDYQGDQMLKEPLGHLHDNKENLGSLQTSLYRLMLERKGFNVVRSQIIYIEAKVEENERGNRMYTNFKLADRKTMTGRRSDLGKAFMKIKGVDIDKETRRDREEGKLNDSSEVLYELVGKNDFEQLKDIDLSVLRIMDKVKTNTTTGRDFFNNSITGNPEYFTSSKLDDRKKQVKDYLVKLKSDKDKLAGNAIKFFNKGKWPDDNATAMTQARKLFGRINKETHSLQQVKNIYGFEDTNPNILIATNFQDGTARLIFLGGVESHRVSFDDEIDDDGKKVSKIFDSNSKTGIFGNLMSDKAFRKRFGFKGLEATDNNLKALQAGMLAMELQSMGHISGVEAIVAGAIDGRQDTSGKILEPLVTSMQVLMPNIKAVSELTRDKQSKGLKSVLSNKVKLSASTYNVDYRDSMINRLADEFLGLGKGALRGTLEANLRAHKLGEMRDADLLKSLITTQNALVQSLRQSDAPSATKDDLAANDEYLLLSKTIAQVANINMSIGTISQELGIESKARTTGRISSEAIRQLDSLVKSTELAINRDFKRFQSKHKDLINRLIKEKGRSKIGSADMHEIFTNMYMVDPTEPIDERKSGDLFNLKHHTHGDLSPLESEYIKFFNENVLDGYGYIFTDTRMKGLREGKTWREGRVPLMTASTENRLSRDEEKNIYKEMAGSSLKKSIKKTTETYENLSTRLHNDFPSQSSPDGGFQGGTTRQNMLGLNPEGNVIADASNLETNLESILNRFMSGNMRSNHYETTLGVYNAMNIIATVEQKENFNSTKDVKEFMDEYIKLIVFNEYDKNDSKLANAVDVTQKVMTMASLGFSPKQMFLEGATNSFASISAMMSQTMMRGNKRFGAGDWAKALASVTTHQELARSIVNEFGLYGSDSEAHGSKDFMETRKNFWWQSKWAFALNNSPYKMFKTQTFVAELYRKGIMPAISHVDGVMKYDISKDTRFESVIKNGKVIPLEKRSTPTQKDQGALLDSFIKDAYQEGTLDENGLPSSPLSYKDINAMKHYSMKLYGSVDKDARVLAQANVWGRMIWKFKNWAIAKKDNWWTTTDGKLSELAGRRIKTPMLDKKTGEPIEGEFYYEFTSMSDMGVIQVMGEMWQGIDSWTKLNMKKTWSELDVNQKETLIKGLTDIILAAMLTALFVSMANIDWFKEGEGKLALSTLVNATADLNIMAMGGSMLDSNPFAVAGYAKRLLGSMYNVVHGTVTGDFDHIPHEAFKMAGGLGKTTESFVE